MNISEAQIRQLGKLSRVSLTDEEVRSFGDDLNKIVAYVEELSQIDVSTIEPMIHMGELALRFRKDEAKEAIGRKGLASSAGYEDGLVRVPKIIE